jgi:hypothetical protein
MRPLYKGLLVGCLHMALVLTIGGKLLIDRATRPRVWAKTAPYDPSLPIRGRYLSLQLEVVAPDTSKDYQGVTLRSEDGKLVAVPAPQNLLGGTEMHIRTRTTGAGPVVVLDPPIAFFIPEHAEDPSRRPSGEELWAEVTIPRKGPPRPIRLGIKKGDGPIAPLNLD